ncbi:serine endoprotease [Lignipirellula cremea]|uniref:Serine endoprotease n=2 Tax=Lignipirellula cremea TaxID=2528010 RepID=A0A518DUJ4_9BACT|nr:serine endoprotease [Lignipirellula cremea]
MNVRNLLPCCSAILLALSAVASAQPAAAPPAVFVPALGIQVLERGDQVQVVRVDKNGPTADQLETGDLLVKCNDVSIRSIAQLRVSLADLKDGARTIVEVARQDRVMPLAIVIGPRPAVVDPDAQIPPSTVDNLPPAGLPAVGPAPAVVPGPPADVAPAGLPARPAPPAEPLAAIDAVQLGVDATLPPVPAEPRSVRQTLEPTNVFCMAVRDYLPGGVLVLDVMPGSPADKAGVRSGDILVGLGQTRIATAAQLNAAIHGFERGDTATLRVVRNGRAGDITVAMEPCEYSATPVTNLDDALRQLEMMKSQIDHLQRSVDVLEYSLRRARVE